MNKGISSSTKRGSLTKKHLFYCMLFLGPIEVSAEVYEKLVIDKSGYWKDIVIDNTSTTNGALLIQDGAIVNMHNADITVGLISGTAIRTYYGNFSAENLKIKVKDSQGRALGISIGPTSQVNLNNMTLVNEGKGEGIFFNTEENTQSGLNLSNSSIETTNGAGILSMFGILAVNNVDVLARGDFAHAINMNTGTTDLTISDSTLSTTGEGSYGVWMIHNGGKMNAETTSISTLGRKSHGVVLQRTQPTAPLSEAVLKNINIETSGEGAHGIYSEGNIDGSNISFHTFNKGSYGVFSVGEGRVNLKDSSILTYRDDSYGVALLNGSKFEGGSLYIVTQGNASHGIYNDRGSFKLDNSHLFIIGGKSAGVLLSSDRSKNNFSYTDLSLLSPTAEINNTLIETSTNNAGNGIVVVNGASSVKLVGSKINYRQGYALSALTTSDNQNNSFSSALYVNALNSVIYGNILATDNNKIYLDLKGDGGYLSAAVTNVELINLQQSHWDITGTSQVKSLNNDGDIRFDSDNLSDQLIIEGNYSGKGSLLMRANLSGDDSPANKVIIKGDVLSGSSTAVSVENLGGLGAETINGIELISVGGTSYGEFTQEGRIVAGAYEYHLTKQAESWYLRNDSPKPTPDPQPQPTPDPQPQPTPDPQPQPIPNPQPQPRPDPTYRVEAGSYLANYIAGNTLFTTSLFERESDPFDHEQSLLGQNSATLWLRQMGGRSSWSDSSGQLKTKSNRYIAQLGGALLHIETPQGGRWSTGVMAGYGHHRNSTISNRVLYRAKGSVNGYSTGLYSTWINDNSGKGGYVDSWLLYNWFNNSVKGDQLRPQYYRSKGITASIEAGYVSEVMKFKGSLGSEYRWFIKPSAQLIYQGVKHHDIIEDNKTRISNVGKNNLQSKLGFRSWIRGRHILDEKTDRYFQPFAEINWIRNSKRHGVKMDATKVELAGAENLAEMKLGLEATLSKQGSIWANTAVQVGNYGYNDSRLTVGGKWRF